MPVGIQRVLILDLSKPQKGARCIVRVDPSIASPRGAKGVSDAQTSLTKLTPMMRFPNRTYGLESSEFGITSVLGTGHGYRNVPL